MITERCPSCAVAPLVARVNAMRAEVYLECDGCGHAELVQRRPSPFPDRYYKAVYKDGRTRNRRYPVVVPDGTVRRTRGEPW